MPWNNKVLDNLEQLYWSPGKISLIKVDVVPTEDGTGYVIPKERLARGRSLFTRATTFDEWRSVIEKKEEILNQVLEIALAIAPSTLLSEAFFAPLGITPNGRITTIGREALARHSALSPRQFTQHDGFYLAPNAIVMMEMKLKAQTSIEQYIKYCTLIALEEHLYGKKDHIGLIFLVPRDSVEQTRRILRLDDPTVLQKVWENPAAFSDKMPLLRLLKHHGDEITDVGRRLRITISTWDEFRATLLKQQTAARIAGNETLDNLLEGMIHQITTNPDCGLRRDWEEG